MKLGVLKETCEGERRVSLVPELVSSYAKLGIEVLFEPGAGEDANFGDEAYLGKGAKSTSKNQLLHDSDILLCVRTLGANPKSYRDDLEKMHPGQLLVGFLDPLDAPSAIQDAAKKGITAFAIELLPRITRAQSMDALSSMATITGYKAAVIAAEALPKIFPMLMTAAGTLLPARVFVIGAGVAGLMAIATAKRLGAKVRAYDVRPAVKEQIQSLGASFVELGLEQKKAEDESGYARAMDESFYQKQRELLGEVLSESDVVISTALVPGKLAPVLITEAMVQAMPKGSVIVDVAAERGGNCELTKPGSVAVKHGVTILGPTNLPSSVPQHASMMFARNMFNFLKPIFIEGRLEIDLEDQVLRESLVAKDGNVVHPRVIDLLRGG